MKTLTVLTGVIAAFTSLSVPTLRAQNGMPTAQPKRLVMIREEVKVGHNADHARNEAGWPAAYEKAKSPNYYLALTSMTGPNTALYLVPFDSYATEAESMKREDKDEVLSGELSRLAARDAEFVTAVTSLDMVGHPELSLGKFPDVAKARFFEVTTVKLKMNGLEGFMAAMKTYGAVRKRVAPNSSYRVYGVVAGMPGPAFVIIESVEDYAQFDQTSADHLKVFGSANPDEKKELDKWDNAVASFESNRFRVDPKQSYVSKEVRGADAEFWSPK